MGKKDLTSYFISQAKARSPYSDKLDDLGTIGRRFLARFPTFLHDSSPAEFRDARTVFRDYGQQTRLSRRGRAKLTKDDDERQRKKDAEKKRKRKEGKKGEKQRDAKTQGKRREQAYNMHHPDATVQL